MPNCTDLNPTDEERAAALLLVAVADHFTVTDPAAPLDEYTLLVCVGVEAYRLADRRSDKVAQTLSRAAREMAPNAPEGITRGEYALVLRKALAGSVHEWDDDDNRPVIPRIPRQRVPARVPRQPVREASTGPKCCKKRMRRDGSQWVCGKCGGWTTAVAFAPAPAAMKAEVR